VTYSFRAYEVTPSAAYPFDVIYRPVIPVRVGGGQNPRLPFFALLDTGADDSKISIRQAQRLGIILDRSRPIVFRSATGVTTGYFAEVTIELRQPPVSYVWKAQVSVLPDLNDSDVEDQTRIILGHTSFFRFFSVAFDFQRNRLKLRPNRLFVGRPR